MLQRAWKGRKARKFVNDLRALARYTWERKVNGELDVLQLTLRNFDVHVPGPPSATIDMVDSIKV